MHPEDIDLTRLSAADFVRLMAQSYPPRCIGPSEDLTAAHRYAAKVELVEEMLALVEEDEEAARAVGAGPRDDAGVA